MAPNTYEERFGVDLVGDENEFDPARWDLPEHKAGVPKRHPETGLDVLIVGGGMGGLMTALECWRKGHTVVGILERSKSPVYSGDIIAIMPSVTSILRHWPDMQSDLQHDQVHVDLNYETHTGEHIFGPTTPSFNDPEHLTTSTRKGPALAAAQIRQRFYRMLLRQTAKVGLRVSYNTRVRGYFEDVAAGKGGVILDDGQVRLATIVVAADGIRSSSELLVAGEHTRQRSSGMSIYRCSYPTSLALEDPVVRDRWANGKDSKESHGAGSSLAADSGSDSGISLPQEQENPVSKSWEFWLGPGMYMGVFMSPEVVAWGFTPREQHDGQGATESWEPDVDPGTIADIMLRTAPDWHPAVPALVRTAPKGSVVHWPLLWRDLRREWVSAGGHVVQVGDSAHTFTPTSGNGATQAIEDAITLATCLQLGAGQGGSSILSTRIYNLLRYDRVNCAQKMSFVNAELKTETDWDAIWRDPAKIRTRFPVWVFNHDPEAYAYEKYGQAFAHLVAGAEFQNTNVPPGHSSQPWTIDQLYQDIANGKRMEDLLHGDWS